MELTITESGALYAMQHRPLRKFRSTRRKQAIARKLIRTGRRRPEMLTDRNIKTEEVCFI
jgi:hypothetical protein